MKRRLLDAPDPRTAATAIALVYAVFGFLWIFFSDQLLGYLVQDPATIIRFAMLKGAAYVLVTAALVFLLVRAYTLRLQRSHAELRDSEQRFRGFFAHSPIAIALYGTDGDLVDANPAAHDLFGLRNIADARGFRFFDDPNLPADARAVLLAGQTVRFEARYDFMALRTSGGYATEKQGTSDLAVVITPLPAPDGSCAGYLLQAADFTERKRLEHQLRQAQKLEALGQLAGGVSHDFNNILTAIFGHVELMRKHLEQTGSNADPLITGLNEIERSSLRAATLTRQLLTFSRRQVVRPEVLDANLVLRGMENMLRRVIREDIHLELCCAAALWTIRADAGQLEQVIMNLVVNARDAMPHGGRITLGTSNVTLDDEYVATHPEARTGPYVLLAVADTGCGMDEATQRRIFEPFFTTKPAGVGTGLGLATVHGIVKQCDGHVMVYSELGRATTFKVFLPALPGQEAATPASHADAADLGGDETVLVCEDDPLVQELTCRTLENGGYKVLAASDAQQALDLAASHSGQLDILVTDVIMTGMNGHELATALTAARPELRVLFVSGYTPDMIAHQGLLDRGAEFLEKPFSSRALLRRVRALLDRPEPSRGEPG